MSVPLHGLIPQLLTSYGYWLIAGVVALESMGLPLPGETTLIAGSILAAASPDFRIEFVIGAAAAGAVVGDNVGFLIGRRYGYRLLVRYGALLRLTEPRLRLGQYLFQRHGGKVVLLGRFVALLRVLTALLAGAKRMCWSRFLVANACGGLLWSIAFGLSGWSFGQALERYHGPLAVGAGGIALVAAVLGWRYARRHEERLQRAADRAFADPRQSPELTRTLQP